MNQKIIRTYSELIQFETFDERLEYLRLYGQVGEDTFGFDRYLNQLFYKSREWLAIRNQVITRDGGCDLAIQDIDPITGQRIYEIHDRILIHHINPLTKDDILNKTEFLLNPEYLICTSKFTHDFIHYGNREFISKGPIIRTKNDTCPWRH